MFMIELHVFGCVFGVVLCESKRGYLILL